MDSIDNYQIKSVLDYFSLKEIAKEKLFTISDRWTKNLKEALFVLLFAVCLIVMYPIFSQGFPVADAFLAIVSIIGVYFLVFSGLMIRKTVVNLKRAIEAYEFDLRRIQEKLTYSDIYIEIPEEDKYEFNSIFKLIKLSLKRIKDNKLKIKEDGQKKG